MHTCTFLKLLVHDLKECVSHLFSFELIISDFNRSVFEQWSKTIKLKSFCVKLENAKKEIKKSSEEIWNHAIIKTKSEEIQTKKWIKCSQNLEHFQNSA